MSDIECDECRGTLRHHQTNCPTLNPKWGKAHGEVVAEVQAASRKLTPENIARIRAVCKTHERFETESWKILALLDALEKISAIRDNIVARQGFHFSENAYPLVAALGAVGFDGAGYEIVSKNWGNTVEALEFYANPRHWIGREFGPSDDFDDERDALLQPVPGAKARRLLASPWR